MLKELMSSRQPFSITNIGKSMPDLEFYLSRCQFHWRNLPIICCVVTKVLQLDHNLDKMRVCVTVLAVSA